LDKDRRDGGEGGEDQDGDELRYPAPLSIVAAEASEHGSKTGHRSDHTDGPGDGGNDGPDESSWAKTPLSSSSVNRLLIPVVTATAAC